MTKNITVDSGKKGEEVTREKLQEKLMVFQLMEKQLETLQQQLMMVDQRLVEIETTKSALHEIVKLKPGNETLVPLGSGLYAKGSITDKSVMTEIGSGVMKEKQVKEATGFLEDKRKEIEEAGKKIQKDMEKISHELQHMAPELQEMASKVQG